MKERERSDEHKMDVRSVRKVGEVGREGGERKKGLGDGVYLMDARLTYNEHTMYARWILGQHNEA